MSDKEKDDTYEEAATQLVDLEDFRKYMEEEEEEEQARQAEAPAAPEVAIPPQAAARPMGASPMAPQANTAMEFSNPSPKNDRDLPKVGPSNSKTCAILGILSLIPFVGILLGPMAMVVSLKEQKAIMGGTAPEAGRSQVNIGLYGGAIGLAVSLVAVAYVMVS